MMIAFIAAHVFVLAAHAQAPAASAPPRPAIVLDAEFDDWKDVQPVTVDPPDAADGSVVELGEVRVAYDDNFVHLLIDFGAEVNVQGLDGTATILLNVDGDDLTGQGMHALMGVDLVIECTPPNLLHPGEAGRGIAIRPTSYEPDPNDPHRPVLNLYDIGLAFAPTSAARRFEFRLARGTFANLPTLFESRYFTGQVVFQGLDGAIKDETEGFAVELRPRPASATTQAANASQPTDPLLRADGTDVRVMSWNAELSAIITDPDPFIRTITAIKPDVILLQELTDETTEPQLMEVLARLQIDGEWRITMGKGGGDLRCAVASRLPLEAIPALEIVAYPEQPDRSLRFAGAMIDVAGKRLLATSVHLKCCGRMGSPEDTTRIMEVGVIQKTLREIIAQTRPDGLVIAGDLNLVGSRRPLEDLMTGLDFDATPLGVADAYQIDGQSNATWADRRQPFVPGRLDYALCSDSTLQVRRCFVYDAFDIAQRWHAVHGTQPTDTDEASDHLPLVFDLFWQR